MRTSREHRKRIQDAGNYPTNNMFKMKCIPKFLKYETNEIPKCTVRNHEQNSLVRVNIYIML